MCETLDGGVVKASLGCAVVIIKENPDAAVRNVALKVLDLSTPRA
jgi:hypothetical protein